MTIQNIFKRYELKYLITEKQKEIIKNEMKAYMQADEFGKSTICNLYFDTDNSLLIRRSTDKPLYKEKLRVRSYGVPTEDSPVFIELKKKYNSVVYKRRVSLPEKEAYEYLEHDEEFIDNQIIHEIDYFKKYYGQLAPAIFLSYDREAFYAKDDHDFRMTFDTNIIWRNYDLNLTKGIYGNYLLDDNQVLMELKTSKAIPLWLVKILSNNHIYKTSFSKYGKAYQTNLRENLHYDRDNI